MSSISSAGYSISSDVSFRVVDGLVLASNHRAREHVLLNIPLFSSLADGPECEGELCAWDRTRFSNVDGLMADPSCLSDAPLGEPTHFDSPEDAWQFLAKRFVLVRSDEDYDAYFSKKRNILDRKHLGTFHQRLGSELLLRKKVDSADWWLAQKFDPETGELRDNLYKFVQSAFLDHYVGEMELAGKHVLDFGCGSGVVARRFADRGARVTGVDPDPAQLARASKTLGGEFTPIQMDLSGGDPLANVPTGPFDFIWTCDVLLFYFYPVDAGDPVMTPSELLTQLAARMSEKGRLSIMMPHGVFWLAPWLGSATRPYTVLSEYADRRYSVTPSLSEVVDAVQQAGLCIRQIHEPRAAEACRDLDPKAFHFANNFPVWWVFECVRSPA